MWKYNILFNILWYNLGRLTLGVKNMYKKVLFSLAILGLLFSGCSKKLPVSLPPVGTSIEGENVGSLDDNGGNGSIGGNGSNGGSIGAGSQKNQFKKGAVDANGKYTGNDGVSRSGIKIVYFASDKYNLDDEQIQRLMSDLPKIKKLTSEGKILVEGNCDEFGTDEYNHALGLKRAKTVRSLLVNAGIDANKINIVSYGESNPICTINAPACHAKNRRVEINRD